MRQRTIIIALIAFLAVGGAAAFSLSRNRQIADTEAGVVSDAPALAQPAVDASAEPVSSSAEIAGNRIVFAKREVTAVPDDGSATAQTTLRVMSADGAKVFPSWTTRDLQFESLLPYGGDDFLIVDTSGEAAPKRVSLQGEAREGFVPPVALATDFAVSLGSLVYLRGGTLDESETPVAPDLVVRASDGTEKVIPGTAFAIGDRHFPFLIIRDFANDGSTVYLQGFENPEAQSSSYALFRIAPASGGVEVLLDEREADDGSLREFIAFTPDRAALYLNRTNRAREKPGTRIVQYDVATKEERTVFQSDAGDFLDPRPELLSPDGTRLALQRSEEFNGGISILDLASGAVSTLVTEGEFLAWASPEHVLSEVYTLSDEGVTAIAWHSVDRVSGKDVALLSQTGLAIGTGLEKVGDVSYVFVGVFPAAPR